MTNHRTFSPQAIILPAKTHPDVVIQSVAARDKEKATAYAKKHGIPEVKASYQGVCYNAVWFEWSMTA